MARTVAWMAMLAVAWQPFAFAQPTRLPDFGSPADTVLNKSREAQLGRSVMLQLRNAGVIVEDPQLTEYINLLGAKLASQANTGEFSFEFFIIDDHRINAFALPGGYIGIHSGLLTATESESELASVIAHEVSHVTQRHIARQIYDTQRTSLLSMATMLAAVLLGAAAGSSDAMQGAAMAGQAAAAQRRINFTRSHEHEADRVGIDVLAAAGFDPHAMATFFDKLARRYGARRESIPEFLQTHPVTATRIADARARASRMREVEANDSLAYHLAKARMQVLGTTTASDALALFDDADGSSNEPGRRYGRALALTRAGRNDEAERLFRELSAGSPGVVAYRIGLAEALMASGLTEPAMAVYEEAAKLSPRNVPLTVSYADALITEGQPAEAHRILLDLFNRVPPTPAQIQLIARAANAEGDSANAHYYMAEYHVSLGGLTPAINQLQMALESPDVSGIDRARFRARLDRLTEFLAEQDERD